jgi:hypothetical protein
MASDPPPGSQRRRRFGRKRAKKLSAEELEALEGQKLPDREAMSVIDGSVSIPIDPAAAVEVLSAEDPPDDD